MTRAKQRQRGHKSVKPMIGTFVLRPVVYTQYRTRLIGGSIALWSSDGSWLNRLIELGTPDEAPFIHASMLFRQGDVLTHIETRLSGGTAENLLSTCVHKWPGQIHVFTVNDRRYNAAKAQDYIRRQLYVKYGFWPLLRAGVRQFPILRKMLPLLPDERINDKHIPPFCSQLVANGARAGNADPKQFHQEQATTPWHLAIKAFSTYQCTLYESKAQFPKRRSDQ
jgi:hypothetical protein